MDEDGYFEDISTEEENSYPPFCCSVDYRQNQKEEQKFDSKEVEEMKETALLLDESVYSADTFPSHYAYAEAFLKSFFHFETLFHSSPILIPSTTTSITLPTSSSSTNIDISDNTLSLFPRLPESKLSLNGLPFDLIVSIFSYLPLDFHFLVTSHISYSCRLLLQDARLYNNNVENNIEILCNNEEFSSINELIIPPIFPIPVILTTSLRFIPILSLKYFSFNSVNRIILLSLPLLSNLISLQLAIPTHTCFSNTTERDTYLSLFHSLLHSSHHLLSFTLNTGHICGSEDKESFNDDGNSTAMGELLYELIGKTLIHVNLSDFPLIELFEYMSGDINQNRAPSLSLTNSTIQSLELNFGYDLVNSHLLLLSSFPTITHLHLMATSVSNNTLLDYSSLLLLKSLSYLECEWMNDGLFNIIIQMKLEAIKLDLSDYNLINTNDTPHSPSSTTLSSTTAETHPSLLAATELSLSSASSIDLCLWAASLSELTLQGLSSFSLLFSLLSLPSLTYIDLQYCPAFTDQKIEEMLPGLTSSTVLYLGLSLCRPITETHLLELYRTKYDKFQLHNIISYQVNLFNIYGARWSDDFLYEMNSMFRAEKNWAENQSRLEEQGAKKKFKRLAKIE